MNERDTAALALDPNRGRHHPNRLVAEVRELLIAKELSPDATGYLGMATAGAGLMLRAFGILPLGGVEAMDRVNVHDPEMR